MTDEVPQEEDYGAESIKVLRGLDGSNLFGNQVLNHAYQNQDLIRH